METTTITPVSLQPNTLSYQDLNAMLNLWGEDGKLQLDKDREAASAYFLQHVNQNTVFFHSLREKLDYLIENGYYDKAILDQYDFDFVKASFKQAYGAKFRFQSYIGALKYYTSYTQKTYDGTRYLERFEDRVVMSALTLAQGNPDRVPDLIEEIISTSFQPATPTFLNAGKANRGELVSCFLLRMEDNMESIGRSANTALQLSKRGGGVAFNLTNLREDKAPIKGTVGAARGPVPVMKIFEDIFSYADQLGQRQGAGAVYIHAHHPDILDVLDTKRENADEKVRIKTLSIGVVVPDVTMEQAAKNEDMYLFSPYDVGRVYGQAMSDISVSEKYREMVDNSQIRKKKIKARGLLSTIAEVESESGYPYIMFEDTVNRANPNPGRVSMSNLCSEILQVSTPSVYNEDLSYKEVGKDISCNLGSMNIASVMRRGSLAKTVDVAVRALTAVSEDCNISSVPSIERGNRESRAIGLGQMNLHGYLGSVRIHYDSPEAVDFTSIYFYTVAYHALKTSCQLAQEKQSRYVGFEGSTYASGQYFDKYINEAWQPQSERVRELFAEAGIAIPTQADWIELRDLIQTHGLYNAYLQAVPPTGSISYINHATASIGPIAARVEARKEGKLGRVYFAAPGMDDSNIEYFKTAYEIGWKAQIDIYAAATPHVDQGLSLTLFFPAGVTTREINLAHIYAWRKGIKTIYYIRQRQEALEGTEVAACVSCEL